MLTLRLMGDEALRELQEKAARLGQSAEAAKVGGQAVSIVIQNHFYELSRRRHRMSNKFDFYAQAAKSVAVSSTSNGSVVTITKLGLAQRWLGGTIRAGAGTSSATGTLTKYLAIPARTEAEGKPPSAFDDLVFVPRRNGKAMLVEALQTKVSISGKKRRTIKRGSEVGSLVMYWLVPEVTQAPDPSVMPTEDEMTHAATEAMGNYLSDYLK